jgi:predicted enzyme related to lactoylglutathione lyase
MRSYWLVYFNVDDVSAAHERAVKAGGSEMMPPGAMPNGHISVLRDPQGAAFGITDSVADGAG